MCKKTSKICLSRFLVSKLGAKVLQITTSCTSSEHSSADLSTTKWWSNYVTDGRIPASPSPALAHLAAEADPSILPQSGQDESHQSRVWCPSVQPGILNNAHQHSGRCSSEMAEG